MTVEQKTALLSQLARKLALDSPNEDTLSDCLVEAEWELAAYLGYLEDGLPSTFLTKAVSLAALYYQRDNIEAQSPGMQAISVTEDGLSQSVTYRAASDWQTQVDGLLASVARYRRVKL